MPALRELQLSFISHCLGAVSVRDDRLPLSAIRSSPAGMSVYRNNALIGFQMALQSSYPVLLRLAGEEWFNGVVAEYQSQAPSTSGDLNDVGAGLAEFLAIHLRDNAPHYGSAFDYFPDVARLEWLVEKTLNEAEIEPPQFGGLSDALVSLDEQFRFIANPTVRVLRSAFPLLQIWEANRRDADSPTIDLRSGADTVAVLKIGSAVQAKRISDGAAAMLEQMGKNLPFAEVLETLESIDPEAALAELIQLQALVGFSTHTRGDCYVN